jgi:putative ABC transport system permease protein
MGVIARLTASNLRYRPAQSIVLGVFALIAAACLTLGLTITLDYQRSFDEHNASLGIPALVLITRDPATVTQIRDAAQNHSGVTRVDTEQVVADQGTSNIMGGEPVGLTFLLADASTNTGLNRWQTWPGAEPLGEGDCYLPYEFHDPGGYQIGDSYTFDMQTMSDQHCRVAGFSDQPALSSIAGMADRIILTHDDYAKIIAANPKNSATIIYIQMTDPNQGSKLWNDISPTLSDPQQVRLSMDYTSLSYYRTFIVPIVTSILFFIALLITVITGVVATHRAREFIAERMADIGSLKAVGYTSGQIAASFVALLGGCALVGSAIGAVASRAALPWVNSLLTTQTSYAWHPRIVPLAWVVGIGAVTLIVVLVAALSMRQVARLTPLVALRQGLQTHSFRRNPLPLDRSRGPVSMLLGLKQARLHIGQQLVTVVIVGLVSLLATAAVSLYWNMLVNPTQFTTTLIGRPPDAVFMAKDPGSVAELQSQLAANPQVRQASTGSFYAANGIISADDGSVMVTAADSYPKDLGFTIVKGRAPEHDNEVMISVLVSGQLGKTVGDSVRLGQKGNQQSFLVVGITQIVLVNAQTVELTTAGLQRILPSYQNRAVSVWLNDGVNGSSWTAQIQKSLTGLDSVSQPAQEVSEFITSISGVVVSVAVGCVGVSALVIALTLFLIVQTLIMSQRRQFGIQKAMGFTTGQLVVQTCWGNLPAVLGGILLGCLGGSVGFAPLFGLVMRAAMATRGPGVSEVFLRVPVGATIGLGAGLAIFAMLMVLIQSLSIRNVPVYRLTTE